MASKVEAVIEDLYRVPEDGKAEIVDGEVVLMPPTGDLPASAGGEVFASPMDRHQDHAGTRQYCGEE